MDVIKIRKDFPVLGKKIDGRNIVYLDNACATLKPRRVIEAMNDYYENYPACGGRSVHRLSTRVSIACEEARNKVQRFINAPSEKEIVFTKNTTEGLNLVARGFGLKKGDAVITTDKEHNSNLVPWHMLREKCGVAHIIAKSLPDGTFDIEDFKKRMKDGRSKIKLASIYHTSNLDGYTLPAKDIIEIAHDAGAHVLLDAAQSVPHIPVDVKRLDADFIAFSGQKMCGPSGIGILYGKEELLETLEPFTVGGDSVASTTYEKSVLLGPPHRFEGGLQNYAGIIGLGAAVDYLSALGMDSIEKHEKTLNARLARTLSEIRHVSLIGPPDPALRGGITSFNIEGVAPHDIAMILDESANIMVRSGTLCAHSWFKARKINSCVRASFYFYNLEKDADALAGCIEKIVTDFCR
jgi:cysteine desulfurase/selenocysteine lyase